MAGYDSDGYTKAGFANRFGARLRNDSTLPGGRARYSQVSDDAVNIFDPSGAGYQLSRSGETAPFNAPVVRTAEEEVGAWAESRDAHGNRVFQRAGSDPIYMAKTEGPQGAAPPQQPEPTLSAFGAPGQPAPQVVQPAGGQPVVEVLPEDPRRIHSDSTGGQPIYQPSGQSLENQAKAALNAPQTQTSNGPPVLGSYEVGQKAPYAVDAPRGYNERGGVDTSMAVRGGGGIPGVPSQGPGATTLRDEQQAQLATYEQGQAITDAAQQARAPLMQEQERVIASTAPDLARQYGRAVDQQKEADARAQDALKRSTDAQERLSSAIRAGVDPRRVFTNGTISQVEAAVAGMVSGLMSPDARGSSIDPLATLRGIIDRDIKLQQDAIKDAEGYEATTWDELQKSLGNQAAADTAYRNAIIDYAQMQLDALAKRIGTIDAAEKAQKGVLALEEEKYKNQAEMVEKDRKEQLEIISMTDKRRKDTADMIRSDMELAMKQKEDATFNAIFPEESDKKNLAKLQGYDLTLRTLNELRKMWVDHGGTIDTPGAGFQDILTRHWPAGSPEDNIKKRYGYLLDRLAFAVTKAESGAAFTEGEFKKRQAEFKSWMDTNHTQQILTQEQSAQLGIQSMEGIMPANQTNWWRHNSAAATSRPLYNPARPQDYGKPDTFTTGK